MKDKDKINEVWNLQGQWRNCAKDHWLNQGKKRVVHIKAAKKKDPHILSRLTFWQKLAASAGIVVPLLRNGEGKIMLSTPTATYYAFQQQRGEGVDFANLETVCDIAVLLAKVHRLAAGFDWREYSLPQKKSLRYLGRLEKTIVAAEKVFKKSQKIEPAWPSLLSRAERSMVHLCDGTLEQLEEYRLRQGDFAYRYINRDGFSVVDGKIVLRDLSNLAEDLAIFDLWQLCRRYLRYNQGGGEGIHEIIAAYEGEKSLREEERKAFFALILFPYDLFKLAANAKERSEFERYLVQERQRESFYGEIFLRGGGCENEDGH